MRYAIVLLALAGVASAAPTIARPDLGGYSVQLKLSASEPPNLTGNTGWWARLSDGHPMLHANGVDYDALYTLGGLSVSPTVPSDNYILHWNNAASQWQPGTLPDGTLPAKGPGAITTGSSTQYVTGLATDAQGRLTAVYGVGGVANILDPRFGAKCDGVTDDGPAILAAANAVASLGGAGGKVYIPGSLAGKACLVKTQVLLHNTASIRYDNITIGGDGPSSWIKAGQNFMGGGCTGPICFEGDGTAYDLKNAGLTNIRVSGFDATTTGTGPLVSWAYTDGSFAINVWLDTNGDEGLYWNNPNVDRNVYVAGCHATNVGGWSKTASDYRAAYNTNANNVTLVGNYAYQVGSFVEHTGDGFHFLGNRFDYSGISDGVGGTTYEVGVVIESPGGASGQNGNGEMANNTISHSLLAVDIGNNSTQGVVVAHNSIYNSNEGIYAGSANNPVLIDGNYLYDTISGSQGYAIECQGAGGCTATNNQIVAGVTPWAYGIYLPDTTSPVIAQNNKVYGNAVTSIMFNAVAGATKVQWLDNAVIDWAGAISNLRIIYRWNGSDFTLSNYPGIFSDTRLTTQSNRQSVVHSNAAPTGGTWKVGDIVVNTSPTASGVDHWVCTSAGTPGTWTAEYGTVQAGTGISVSGNTVSASAVPNSALANSSVTINTPTGMGGWGTVSLGGSLSPSWANESANTVFAGPTSGIAAAPTWRALVAGDIPSLSSTYCTLTGCTLSGALVFGAGATATGSSSFDLSGSSGTFKFPSGAITGAGNSMQLAANGNYGCASGGNCSFGTNSGAGNVQIGNSNASQIFGGTIRTARVGIADGNYTYALGGYRLAYTAPTAARAVTLIPLANCDTSNVCEFEIVNESSTAETITVAPASGLINGAASVTCTSAAYGFCHGYCTGSACFMTANR